MTTLTQALRDLLLPVDYLRLRGTGLVIVARMSSTSRAAHCGRSSSCPPNVPRRRDRPRRDLIDDLFVPNKVWRACWPALETAVPGHGVRVGRQELVSMGLALKIVSQDSPGPSRSGRRTRVRGHALSRRFARRCALADASRHQGIAPGAPPCGRRPDTAGITL
jgi:hypothetical protein